MVFMLIPAPWLKERDPALHSIQKDCELSEALDYNFKGFNVYHYPNHPKEITSGFVQAEDVNVFNWVFVDCDLKDGVWPTKEKFIEELSQWELKPTKIIDSGNGIHAYWFVTDLDAKSFLSLSRRLCRKFNTDQAVTQLKQLMRVPTTLNVKDEHNPKPCETLVDNELAYTCEQLSKALPPITQADAEFCTRHYDSAYKVETKVTKISDKLPHRFQKLLNSSKEVKQIYRAISNDRSGDDFRLGHILLADGFNKTEAMSVLVNCAKARERAPHHRIAYAQDIIDKIGLFEEAKDDEYLSKSVTDILKQGPAIKGVRFPCWNVFDGTHHGFRRTHVMGLVGGAGSGKTTLALNYFYWFTKLNPNFIHVFVSLEQPAEEIAIRWQRLCGKNEALHDKVHVMSNYTSDNSHRNLSMDEIEAYVLELKERLGCEVGCLVIDHIGALRMQGKEGEFQGIIELCHQMKALAKRTNTFLIMQSQTSREKAGIGDLELDKDAAYGTSMFEWYVDWLVTTWQPLKRVLAKNTKMAVTAFKMPKIRHKNILKDHIKEDEVYALKFDPETERLRELTQQEEKDYHFLNKQATALRNKDRKREPTQITTITWGANNGTTPSD